MLISAPATARAVLTEITSLYIGHWPNEHSVNRKETDIRGYKGKVHATVAKHF